MSEDTKCKLLFIGDSITDCGRSYPVGCNGGLGTGYVNLINNLIPKRECGNKKFEILNTGISGNRITDLEKRWNQDVLEHKPDWVCIKIGVNDVWRQFDKPHLTDQVSPEIFEETYRKLINQTIKNVQRIILIGPFYIEPDLTNPMRKQLDLYGNIVKKLSKEYKLDYVDTQNAFDNYLKSKSLDTVTEDRVHPNQTGHMIIAEEVLKQMECL